MNQTFSPKNPHFNDDSLWKGNRWIFELGGAESASQSNESADESDAGAFSFNLPSLGDAMQALEEGYDSFSQGVGDAIDALPITDEVEIKLRALGGDPENPERLDLEGIDMKRTAAIEGASQYEGEFSHRGRKYAATLVLSERGSAEYRLKIQDKSLGSILGNVEEFPGYANAEAVKNAVRRFRENDETQKDQTDFAAWRALGAEPSGFPKTLGEKPIELAGQTFEPIDGEGFVAEVRERGGADWRATILVGHSSGEPYYILKLEDPDIENFEPQYVTFRTPDELNDYVDEMLNGSGVEKAKDWLGEKAEALPITDEIEIKLSALGGDPEHPENLTIGGVEFHRRIEWESDHVYDGSLERDGVRYRIEIVLRKDNDPPYRLGIKENDPEAPVDHFSNYPGYPTAEAVKAAVSRFAENNELQEDQAYFDAWRALGAEPTEGFRMPLNTKENIDLGGQTFERSSPGIYRLRGENSEGNPMILDVTVNPMPPHKYELISRDPESPSNILSSTQFEAVDDLERTISWAHRGTPMVRAGRWAGEKVGELYSEGARQMEGLADRAGDFQVGGITMDDLPSLDSIRPTTNEGVRLTALGADPENPEAPLNIAGKEFELTVSDSEKFIYEMRRGGRIGSPRVSEIYTVQVVVNRNGTPPYQLNIEGTENDPEFGRQKFLDETKDYSDPNELKEAIRRFMESDETLKGEERRDAWRALGADPENPGAAPITLGEQPFEYREDRKGFFTEATDSNGDPFEATVAVTSDGTYKIIYRRPGGDQSLVKEFSTVDDVEQSIYESVNGSLVEQFADRTSRWMGEQYDRFQEGVDGAQKEMEKRMAEAADWTRDEIEAEEAAVVGDTGMDGDSGIEASEDNSAAEQIESAQQKAADKARAAQEEAIRRAQEARDAAERSRDAAQKAARDQIARDAARRAQDATEAVEAIQNGSPATPDTAEPLADATDQELEDTTVDTAPAEQDTSETPQESNDANETETRTVTKKVHSLVRSGLNMRQSPNGAVIGGFEAGDEVRVVTKADGSALETTGGYNWVKVVDENGNELGWVSSGTENNPYLID